MGTQARVGVRSQFSIRRRDSHALGVTLGRYTCLQDTFASGNLDRQLSDGHFRGLLWQKKNAFVKDCLTEKERPGEAV